MLGVDTETLGKKYTNMTDEVVVLGLCPDEDTRLFIPRKYAHHFKSVVEDPNITKALTNVKFDAHRLANAGIKLAGRWADTVMLDFLLDEDTRENHHGLKDCVFDYFGIPMAEYNELFGREDITKIVPGHEKWEQFLDYASLDPWASRKLALFLLKKLDNIRLWHDKDFTLKDHYWDVEEPQLKTLYGMERRGVCIDVDRLHRVGESMQKEIDGIAAELNKLAGWPINPNSVPQIVKLLFEDLGLEPISYTPKGVPQTTEAVLAHFAENGVEECELILTHRKAAKLKGTYCEGILKRLHTDGHIHTTYSATKVTGRLGSQNPNLQNIPKPDSDIHGIRKAFIADPGYILIVGDYSQLEMRVLAEAADEQSMIKAIEDGLDMHCFTASMMFGTTYEEMYQKAKVEEDPEWKTRRGAAKAIGFGLVYGKTVHGLAQTLGCSREEAQEFIDKFFDAFPGIRDYMEGYQAFAKEHGYVQTISGRFRRLSKIHSHNYAERGHAERQAINTPIQGSAADIVKAAMVSIDADERLRELGYRLLMQIHDELVGQCPLEVAEECAEIIRGYMENPFLEPLRVPLVAEQKIVPNWAEGK
jgi:DNA polymerase-1